MTETRIKVILVCLGDIYKKLFRNKLELDMALNSLNELRRTLEKELRKEKKRNAR